MKKIFFISDAHFGAQNTEQEQEKALQFYSFLEYFEAQDAKLIIVGDLFDFWFEYRYTIPRRHFRIISLLSHLCHNGKEIHYIAGNHDFWLDSFMKNEVGLKLHPNELVLKGDNKNVFIKHGDGLLKKDYSYRFLKRILRNPVNIFLYRLFHPDFGIPLALFFSHLSREASKDRSKYSDDDYRNFAYTKISEGYDFVVLGHTHWPALEKYQNGWYINPGNWIDDFTYAVINNGVPQVLKWQKDKGVKFEITLPPGNIK